MHDDGYFDEPVAARYDDTYDDQFAPTAVEPVVDLLAELAGDGRALELGVGTGRVALPLARRGVSVHGIELSRAMADQLRASPVRMPSGSRSVTSRRRWSRGRSGSRTSS